MPVKSRLPSYKDGKAFVCELVKVEDEWGNEIGTELQQVRSFWFEERGINDNLRFTSGAANVKVERKLRTRQDKTLEPEMIIQIDGKHYVIINSNHFYDKDNYPQSDLTLGKYNG